MSMLKKHLSAFFIRSLLSFLLFLNTVNSIHAFLPDTGQTKCYDEFREIACPSPGQAFYGQDGNHQGPQPAYHVSGDGLAVADLNTNLIWQLADDGVLRAWAAAVSYCENLNLGGLSDWRLPSCQELISIVDYRRYNPAINPAFSSHANWYWSNTSAPAFERSVWVVDFVDGLVGNDIVANPKYVRCVRSAP